MEERINKPRVFLSHSKKNSDFIEKLANDLRRCQIDPWLDTDQIRHGKSWQDSIFELGLPTCDAIIVYFTELSIQSSVVKKEMDVGLLQNLKDSNVAFLPYVSNEKLRGELRPDIQALQVPEWNDNNYHSLLPRVVAEIWRSYLERTVSSATKAERLKRVEAELELEKYRNQPEDVFSKSENKEFEFVQNSFDQKIPFSVFKRIYNLEANYSERQEQYTGVIHLSTIVALLSNIISDEYKLSYIYEVLRKNIFELIGKNPEDDTDLALNYHKGFATFTDELLMHGLIDQFTFTSRADYSEFLEHRLELSKKYYRFRYWLAYQRKLPDDIFVELDK
jgi:hypothetical protein